MRYFNFLHLKSIACKNAKLIRKIAEFEFVIIQYGGHKSLYYTNI